MAESTSPTVNDFVIALLESTKRTLERSIEGLAAEHLRYQPSSDTNSISWLAWHYSRWMDTVTARAVAETDVWVTDGWYVRFGMSETADGRDDTPEQVARFVPERDLLMGYVAAAHQESMRRIASLSPEDLAKPATVSARNVERPLWRSLANLVMDFTQHIGQIAYVRGLISGFGWH